MTKEEAGGENRITSGMSVYPVGTGAPFTRLERFDTTYIPSSSRTCSATSATVEYLSPEDQMGQD